MPAKGGEQAYALLREALRDTGRIGIAKFILREAQHLAAIEPIEDAIVLTLMRFADELATRSRRSRCRAKTPESRNSTWRRPWSRHSPPTGIRRSTPTNIATT